jgi:hypothetical protein
MAQPKCAIEVPALRLVGADGGMSACHFAQELEKTHSVTEIPDELVEQAPDKDVLAEVAEAAVDKPPPLRVSPAALIGFVLGVATPITAFVLRDLDVFVRGLIVMALGIPAVFACRAGLRAVAAGKGRILGRAPARIGWVFAWIGLVVWALYCAGWLIGNTLPEASP